MSTSLAALVKATSAYKGSWQNAQLAQDIKMFLWKRYDPNDNLIYPTLKHWDLLLLEAMSNDSYDNLDKSEVLSVLFGLIHRTRIVDGLWETMFTRDVTQQLLGRLLVLVAEGY
ncbi:MAG TPA: hypothetical protein VLH84_00345 [Patescibacteria group bacterium]|nr:hypothetical protein [Patescibacteria group bacterium]